MTERGLHRVSTPDLGALRSLVERGEARCPLSRAELLACGFSANVDDVLASLGGLDAEASTRSIFDSARPARRQSKPTCAPTSSGFSR